MKKLTAFFFGMFLLVWRITIAPAEAESLVLGYSGAGLSTDLRRVIEKEKIWQKHGLDVRSIYFNSGTLLAQAMVGGDIGVSDSDVPAQLNLKMAGILDVKAVAVTINRLEHYFVVRNPVKTAGDLKGKRIAISRYGSASDITTRLVLRYWRLDPDKDVVMLQSGNTPTRIAALVVGYVDGALVSPDHLHKILASGCCRVLADLSELPMDYARFGIVVPTSMLKMQRETLRKLLESYVEGIHIFKTRPEVVLSVLKEEGIGDRQVAQEVYERVARSLREFPVPEPKGIQAALDSLTAAKVQRARAEDFMDTSLMEEIKKSGFIDRLYGRR